MGTFPALPDAAGVHSDKLRMERVELTKSMSEELNDGYEQPRSQDDGKRFAVNR
jgi:hypothetical protein